MPTVGRHRVAHIFPAQNRQQGIGCRVRLSGGSDKYLHIDLLGWWIAVAIRQPSFLLQGSWRKMAVRF